MALIHYLFLGHFERDGEVVRFEKRPNDRTYKPMVRGNIDMTEVRAVAQEVSGVTTGDADLPPAWSIWEECGYLICEKYTRNQEVIEFVTRLVKRTGCDIYDVGAGSVITLPEWLSTIREYLRSPVVRAKQIGTPTSA
jgi:hypothetical protein